MKSSAIETFVDKPVGLDENIRVTCSHNSTVPHKPARRYSTVVSLLHRRCFYLHLHPTELSEVKFLYTLQPAQQRIVAGTLVCAPLVEENTD
jgi:hypothetical protein